MPARDTNGVTAEGELKAKVFISYSRRDMAFVDRLEPALVAQGYKTLIDREEIYAFEDWWKRIETLITGADTVVFVLSPDSVASEVCVKEIACATSNNKRFAPIVCRRVDDRLVPEALARLNFIFFDRADEFEASLLRLTEALQTNIGWIRKHTEFCEAARRWSIGGRPSGLLLRSPALEEAERWIAARPSSAPTPTSEAQEFITESRGGATRRRNILTGSLGAGLVIALALAGLAYWQRGVAIAQRKYAEQALDAGVRTSNSMALSLAMRLRKQAGMPSALVKYLLDSALVLEDKLGSLGRTTPELLDGQARAFLEASKTRLTIGDLTGALNAAERARRIFTGLLSSESANQSTRLNIGVSYELIGDVLLARGQTADALTAYRAALATAQAVARADSENEDAQLAVAIDDVHIGDALNSELETNEALAAYRNSLAIRQRYVNLHPNNVEWKRGLGISYERIAATLTTQHKTDEAFVMAEKRLVIAQELASSEPSDTAAQRDLSVADDEVGETLLAAQKSTKAVTYFEKALEIRQILYRSDQDNAVWRRDVAISNNQLGDAFAAEGKTTEALAAYQKGLAIEKTLSSVDKNNFAGKADVALSDIKIGDLLKSQGKLAQAQQFFGDCGGIAQQAIKVGPNPNWQVELRLCAAQIGFISYRFIMMRDFTSGLQAAQQAISLQPDLIWLYAHEAHALMFLNRTDEARAVYLKYRGDTNVFNDKVNRVSWSALIFREFSELRNAGLTNPMMTEIEKALTSG